MKALFLLAARFKKPLPIIAGILCATLINHGLAGTLGAWITSVALAAHYAAPLMVIAGTTLGMLVADVPAVFVGNKFAAKIPMKLVHSIAAGVFALMGVATLLGAGSKLGFQVGR